MRANSSALGFLLSLSPQPNPMRNELANDDSTLAKEPTNCAQLAVPDLLGCCSDGLRYEWRRQARVTPDWLSQTQSSDSMRSLPRAQEKMVSRNHGFSFKTLISYLNCAAIMRAHRAPSATALVCVANTAVAMSRRSIHLVSPFWIASQY